MTMILIREDWCWISDKLLILSEVIRLTVQNNYKRLVVILCKSTHTKV